MLVYCPVIASIKPSLIQSVIRSNRLPMGHPLAEQPGQQRDQRGAYQGDPSASHELFYPQLGVKTLLDGGRRRTKNLYGVVKRTVPAGQVRQ